MSEADRPKSGIDSDGAFLTQFQDPAPWREESQDQYLQQKRNSHADRHLEEGAVHLDSVNLEASMEQNEQRFQRLRRLPHGADALEGADFKVHLASYRQSVLSDHEIQIMHALQLYEDVPAQQETGEHIPHQHHQVHFHPYYECTS